MSSKFFNNVDSPLFNKFKGIVEGMPNFDTFPPQNLPMSKKFVPLHAECVQKAYKKSYG